MALGDMHSTEKTTGEAQRTARCPPVCAFRIKCPHLPQEDRLLGIPAEIQSHHILVASRETREHHGSFERREEAFRKAVPCDGSWPGRHCCPGHTQWSCMPCLLFYFQGDSHRSRDATQGAAVLTRTRMTRKPANSQRQIVTVTVFPHWDKRILRTPTVISSTMHAVRETTMSRLPYWEGSEMLKVSAEAEQRGRQKLSQSSVQTTSIQPGWGGSPLLQRAECKRKFLLSNHLAQTDLDGSGLTPKVLQLTAHPHPGPVLSGPHLVRTHMHDPALHGERHLASLRSWLLTR